MMAIKVIAQRRVKSGPLGPTLNSTEGQRRKTKSQPKQKGFRGFLLSTNGNVN